MHVTVSIQNSMAALCEPTLCILFRVHFYKLGIIGCAISHKRNIMVLAHLMLEGYIIFPIRFLHLHIVKEVPFFRLQFGKQNTAAAISAVPCGLYHIPTDRAHIKNLSLIHICSTTA